MSTFLLAAVGFFALAMVLAYAAGVFSTKKKGGYTDDAFLVDDYGDHNTSASKVSGGDDEGDDDTEGKLTIGIFVGSQTGTAQEFAETLESEGNANNFFCTVIDMEEYEPEMFQKYERVIFCVATYGEGDPCDNAAEFDQWLKEESRSEEFEGVRYTVFGLGNRQYEHYNAQGRAIDKLLAECGAERMYKYGEGDDDGSLEDDFEEWKKDLWVSLRRSEYGETVTEAATVDIKPSILPFVVIDTNGPRAPRPVNANAKIALVSKPYFETVPLKIIVNRELRQTRELGSTIHVEFAVKGTQLASYKTADNMGIIPSNRKKAVEGVASLLGYDLDRWFDLVPNTLKKGEPKLIFPTPCSVRQALTLYCDLHASPTRPFLRTLAAYATGQEQKRLLFLASSEGVNEYKTSIVERKLSLAEVLRQFVALKLPFDAFVQICPRMKERLYTIASAPAMAPNRIHLAVTVVEEKVDDGDGNVFRGLCSGFLDDSRVPDRSGPRPSRNATKNEWPAVHAFLRESSFKAPRDPLTPLIMFGPGTGIAPMRALLQDRMVLVKTGVRVGPSLLFFGCCKSDVDFIYKDELQDMLDAGALTELHLAFSREQRQKVYVQHKLMEQKEKIWKLVNDLNAYVFVCGGISMGNDVSKAFESIACEAGENGKEFVSGLKNSGRYIQELWS